ncbi:phosphate signaling complex protein PhoU [Thiospirochaeta perfilievii]|uniref:Phosphate-specific transport system accessory protein PhoU n=1 Tax=Thiospirochaeta perfilievii TaxID=252967 RepID=A0A5C1QDE1_9SPIO|nr:phosphate signaling complex protein PhoU [Thiospirochaeta perfilievii]QEN05090.1 phosphate signaling complex protein PhoU [Thiospirochaeta perfilievii]
MDIRTHYREELNGIMNDVVVMGDMVISSLHKGLESLLDNNSELAKEVIVNDQLIDDFQLQIEDRSTLLIAKENPVATDLREILTVLKIVVELERLGDHGKHLAEKAGKVSNEGLKIAAPYLSDMTEFGCQMVKESLESFIQQDSKWAEEIAARDNYIDDKYSILYGKLIDIIKEKPHKSENLVPLLFLNRFLERIGDRVTNICESVVYVITCKHKSL